MPRLGDDPNMRPQDCGSFERCDATLCPLGGAVGWLDTAAWFPGEAICARQGPKPRWVAVQRRIEKAVGRDASRGYFTVPMLEALTKVTTAIRGLDVDTPDEKAAEAAWCAKRKRRVWRPGEREAMRERARARFDASKLRSKSRAMSEKRSAYVGGEEVGGLAGSPGHVGGGDAVEARLRAENDAIAGDAGKEGGNAEA